MSRVVIAKVETAALVILEYISHSSESVYGFLESLPLLLTINHLGNHGVISKQRWSGHMHVSVSNVL